MLCVIKVGFFVFFVCHPSINTTKRNQTKKHSGQNHSRERENHVRSKGGKEGRREKRQNEKVNERTIFPNRHNTPNSVNAAVLTLTSARSNAGRIRKQILINIDPIVYSSTTRATLVNDDTASAATAALASSDALVSADNTLAAD